jgi:uncharacterized membrane protein (DUF485 family)
MSNRNARIGMRLFIVYLLFYSAFVLTNAFAPDAMEATPIAGVNLAVLSGFGLILLALVLALIYGYAASDRHQTNEASQQGGEQ